MVEVGRRTMLKRSSLAALAAGTTALAWGLGRGVQIWAQGQGRWLKISRVAGPVSYQRQGSRAALGDDLLEAPGDGVITGNNASTTLAMDNNIGTIAVAANTQLVVRQLSSLANGAQITLLNVPRGQARLQVRQFTNPDSRLELHTPSGVAAVRGTDFGVSVSDTGQTAIGTLEGSVEAVAEGQTVRVEAGFASTIRPGEPPTAPQPLDRELALELTDQYRRERVVYLRGRINPTNRLRRNGADIPITRSGGFTATVVLSSSTQSFTLTVENPLGESRDFRIRAWQLDDLDRG